MKEQLLDFLEDEVLCVVSTVDSKGNPESALVAFSENEKLETMIGTSKESRKFRNITRNPNVSIVFGPQEKKAIQLEGVARELTGQELVERKKSHFKKQPWAIKYEADPNQTYILINPVWIRMVESGPKVLGEMRFD